MEQKKVLCGRLELEMQEEEKEDGTLERQTDLLPFKKREEQG